MAERSVLFRNIRRDPSNILKEIPVKSVILAEFFRILCVWLLYQIPLHSLCLPSRNPASFQLWATLKRLRRRSNSKKKVSRLRLISYRLKNSPCCFGYKTRIRTSFISNHSSLRTLEIFVTRGTKYQTCLIFGFPDTNDKNTAYLPRTLGLSPHGICHE